MSVEQVVSSIKNSDAPAEDKIRAQEMVLEAYQAEVEDLSLGTTKRNSSYEMQDLMSRAF